MIWRKNMIRKIIMVSIIGILCLVNVNLSVSANPLEIEHEVTWEMDLVFDSDGYEEPYALQGFHWNEEGLNIGQVYSNFLISDYLTFETRIWKVNGYLEFICSGEVNSVDYTRVRDGYINMAGTNFQWPTNDYWHQGDVLNYMPIWRTQPPEQWIFDGKVGVTGRPGNDMGWFADHGRYNRGDWEFFRSPPEQTEGTLFKAWTVDIPEESVYNLEPVLTFECGENDEPVIQVRYDFIVRTSKPIFGATTAYGFDSQCVEGAGRLWVDGNLIYETP
jgi:hypothetical protein